MPQKRTKSSPTILERLLGAFVVFQLFVIPIGTYIKMVPVRFPESHGEINGDLQVLVANGAYCREPIQSVFDAIATGTARWNEISGQGQCWALFTSFGTQASFPIVELHWRDREPVRLTCRFEPADPARYANPPEPSCRLYNFEYRMALFHGMVTAADWQRDPEFYRVEAMNSARDMRKSLNAYVCWKSTKYLHQHPELPPPERIVLLSRVLPDPLPGASRFDRPAPVEIPVARWWPNRGSSQGELPFDVWDPLAKEFVRLSVRGGE